MGRGVEGRHRSGTNPWVNAPPIASFRANRDVNITTIDMMATIQNVAAATENEAHAGSLDKCVLNALPCRQQVSARGPGGNFWEFVPHDVRDIPFPSGVNGHAHFAVPDCVRDKRPVFHHDGLRLWLSSGERSTTAV